MKDKKLLCILEKIVSPNERASDALSEIKEVRSKNYE